MSLGSVIRQFAAYGCNAEEIAIHLLVEPADVAAVLRQCAPAPLPLLQLVPAPRAKEGTRVG
jgi:hypothetical protein